MAKVVEMTERQAIAEKVLAELRARSGQSPLTTDEMLAFAAKLPGMPPGWSSADDVRELRGPLPDDETAVSDDRH
ncbi:MAG TPA: hypothetical protein VHW00_20710 [Thermoanaerobaculia bacterium]|nr:hypothetical protein [Thermoanaerobaculia bacterium]